MVRENEDREEARRSNLEKLATACGSRAALGRRIGKAESLINNYIGRRKKLKEYFARSVEQALDLDEYELDRVHDDDWAAAVVARHTKHGSKPPRRSSIIRQSETPGLKGGVLTLEQLDVRASMGVGIDVPDREPVIDLIRVPLNYITERFPHVTHPRNLKIITGFGDSMKGTFNHGDPLIVDTGIKTMEIDAIYVYAYQSELFIKRIQRLPDRSLKVISDNRAAYDPYTLDAKQREDVQVIGRVVCAVNMNMIS